jgi:cysteine desulfurase
MPSEKPVYLDCAATTPLDPRVRDEMLRYLDDDIGNAGSRTHAYGRRAREAVERARDQVAAVVGASRGDVIFTSGATESNNLAILGLLRHGLDTGRTHVVSTAIEHHAVLEPLGALERHGVRIDRVRPESGGAVDPAALVRLVRPETLLVSVMHVNNETGVVQPIEAIAAGLEGHDALLHVDAAQGFGKDIPALRHRRIDLISVSGHKIHAPMGIGALVMRKRAGRRPPLQPVTFGGGQERGLRPGTLPVHLIAALGRAAELCLDESESRAQRCRELRRAILEAFAPLEPMFNGDPARAVPHIVNLSIPGVDADLAIEAWEDLAAVSHGAACTAQRYVCSHVLDAMGISGPREEGALRLSWCHLTPLPDLAAMVAAINRARQINGSVVP